jgi:glycerophosphoryl diester phosphodiesterase
VIELRRPPGRFARVGHRGAPALALENTLRGLRLAVELGCDMLEFDVLPLHDGTLVLAHSNDLREVTHGAARGRVRTPGRSLERLRGVAPELPTLDEALAACAAELPQVGLQLDLKRRGIEDRVVAALRRHGVRDRAWVSAFDARLLRRVAELDAGLPRSYTLPRDRFGMRRAPTPFLRGGLAAVRSSLPRRVPALLRRARAVALTLHYSVTTPAVITRTHDLGASVYVWTVNDPDLARNLVAAGADGIITDDPRIFAALTT